MKIFSCLFSISYKCLLFFLRNPAGKRLEISEDFAKKGAPPLRSFSTARRSKNTAALFQSAALTFGVVRDRAFSLLSR